MLTDSIVSLINDQINKELYSAYLYLDMANYYADRGYDGFENWFKVQAQEEESHAMIFRQYLINNGHRVVLGAIADPSKEYKDLKEPLVDALKHEQYVTASINAIYEEALKQKDWRTQQMLFWFIEEQGEEEENAMKNISDFENFGGERGNLYPLNKELASRSFSPPSLEL